MRFNLSETHIRGSQDGKSKAICPSEVYLTQNEFYKAAQTGIARRISSILKGLSGSPNSGWDVDVEGACAEHAVANALGIKFVGTVDTFKSCGDVGPYEVRSSRHENGRLIIRPDDRSSSIFILATGIAPHFKIRGWIKAAEAKKRDDWFYSLERSRPPAWNVPQSALRPIAELKRSINLNPYIPV